MKRKMLVIYDPTSHLVKRIVIPGPGEVIYQSHHVRSGETSTMVPAIPASPLDRAAFVAALAPYGLIMP